MRYKMEINHIIYASVSITITQLSIILVGFITAGVVAKMLLISLRMWLDGEELQAIILKVKKYIWLGIVMITARSILTIIKNYFKTP
jgi:hypothetical protein